MSAIYPGSFDPVTNGHIDIARRSAKIMGRIIVAVLDNPSKNPLFNVSQRVALLQEAFANDSNIEVDAFSGLLADYAHKRGIQVIIRGVRGPEDITKEMPYVTWNSQLSQLYGHEIIKAGLAQSLETLYFTAKPVLMHISSSIVKEVAAHSYPNGLDDTVIAQAVPPAVRQALKEKFS
ncbi:MAG: pantetheine-phosphate adenylyltransferase [Defluviitaleaceae bacterium]|nr:pantetheine-phosphate adenylyltransferase [Defluviitaleaceae bacterium]